MVRASDSTENAIYHGIVTILEHPILDSGDGSLEVQGSVYTDNIIANTIGNPVILEGSKFIDNTYILSNNEDIINVPDTDEYTFYINNGLLKSIDSSNILTTYQPLITKGDLMTHNGTTQVRLPGGNDRDILQYDISSSTGLSWGSSRRTEDTSFILYSTIPTIVIDQVYGSLMSLVSPRVTNGGCANFFVSKSIDSIYGHIVTLNSSPSLLTDGLLHSSFDPYKSLKHYKDYSEAEGDGNYSSYNNYKYTTTNVSLSGTTWSFINNELVGALMISVYSDTDGPCATFFICKSDSSSITGSILRISSSPSTLSSNLSLRWTAGNGIEIHKTTINDDGLYYIIDNFQRSYSGSITLSGTSSTQAPKTLFRFYENKSFIIRVYSNTITNSPKSIVTFSKNSVTTYGNKTSVNSPGTTTNELLNITWGPNSLLFINKTGTSYDGVYIVDICINK